MHKSRTKSESLYEELSCHLPGGVNSPVRAHKNVRERPIVIKEASGAVIVDADGHEYTDLCLCWGAHLHGHAHPEIVRAASRRLEKGLSFGLAHEEDRRLAAMISQLVPSCEMVRFVTSGTEATMSAVRLARAYTNRRYVITFSGAYHGHADQFLVQAGSGMLDLREASSAGIPPEFIRFTISLPYNDIEAFDKALDSPLLAHDLACVIVEPVVANMGVVLPKEGFLAHLRRRTAERGALLLFDEVVTGFRLARGGAQERYGIAADLTCFGKVMGGGLPCAAFGGKKAIMQLVAPLGSVYQAGTQAGNPVAMEAGYQALTLAQAPGFYERLEQYMRLLTAPVQDVIAKRGLAACMPAVGSMTTLFLGVPKVESLADARQVDQEKFQALFSFLFHHGVYIPPSPFEAWFISSAHSKNQLERVSALICQFLAEHY